VSSNSKNISDKNDYLARIHHQIHPLIKGRGFKITKNQMPHDIFDGFPEIKNNFSSFYRLMKKYPFRLLFYDVLKNKSNYAFKDLIHYSSSKSVSRFLEQLKSLQIIQDWDEKKVQLTQPACKLNSGWLLEWLIATLLYQEFDSVTIFNVGLRGTNIGGDYDVLANWLGRLLYLELKCSPPKGIHNPQIKAFLQRVSKLKPDIAIFINDTHLRVKDKIVLMFEEELINLNGIEMLKIAPVERIEEQIFHIHHYIYLLNTKRSIQNNLKTVFHDHLKNNLPLINLL
jgi:hypothetical protein